VHTSSPAAAAVTPAASTTSSNLLPDSLRPKPQAQGPLPTPVRRVYEKKYHLTPQQVAEMRKLRAEDPKHWTRYRLAEKFECSRFFVGLVCMGEAPEVREDNLRKLEEVKAKWGPRKREAREMRGERRKLWGRDA
jgi:hypothetical protein